MPQKVAEDKARVCYLEWKDVDDQLNEMAHRKRCDKSDLIREATQMFVAKHGMKLPPAEPKKSELKGVGRGPKKTTKPRK